VRIQILMVLNMEMTAFWYTAPRVLAEADLHFRRFRATHHLDDDSSTNL
jgi:hypothetical protein